MGAAIAGNATWRLQVYSKAKLSILSNKKPEFSASISHFASQLHPEFFFRPTDFGTSLSHGNIEAERLDRNHCPYRVAGFAPLWNYRRRCCTPMENGPSHREYCSWCRGCNRIRFLRTPFCERTNDTTPDLRKSDCWSFASLIFLFRLHVVGHTILCYSICEFNTWE